VKSGHNFFTSIPKIEFVTLILKMFRTIRNDFQNRLLNYISQGEKWGRHSKPYAYREKSVSTRVMNSISAGCPLATIPKPLSRAGRMSTGFSTLSA
jgi:hypothetical protein